MASLVVWSNAGRHEAIISEGDETVWRSGLVHRNYAAAKRAGLKKAGELVAAEYQEKFAK